MGLSYIYKIIISITFLKQNNIVYKFYLYHYEVYYHILRVIATFLFLDKPKHKEKPPKNVLNLLIVKNYIYYAIINF